MKILPVIDLENFLLILKFQAAWGGAVLMSDKTKSLMDGVQRKSSNFYESFCHFNLQRLAISHSVLSKITKS